MRLIFVRHGEPDYVKDSLTERGFMEAELLSERLIQKKYDAIYVSPLGRAKDTSVPTLQKLGAEATELPWLREFDARIFRPDGPGDRRMITWDWMPSDWATYPDFYDFDKWANHPIMQEAHVRERYDEVVSAFRALLASHGYEKEGTLYRAVKSNNDTILFFCHFGVAAVMLSDLMHVSPMILWHSLVAAPSSVTEVVTEEREEGIAYFRMTSYGDVSHLYAKGVEPAFAARFCESYGNAGQRHVWSDSPV